MTSQAGGKAYSDWRPGGLELDKPGKRTKIYHTVKNGSNRKSTFAIATATQTGTVGDPNGDE